MKPYRIPLHLFDNLGRQGQGLGLLSLLLVSFLLAACGGGSNGTDPAPPVILSGKTSFISADTTQSFDATVTLDNLQSASTSSATTTRKIEEGDIYRVLDDGKTLINLNNHRGLQIIDISDASQPKIIGRAAMTGYPVEMYRLGTRVYVLLNGWSEYKRILKNGKDSLDHFSGAGVITVDIARPDAPQIIASARIPGTIQTSRLSSGDGGNALYVAAMSYDSAKLGGDVLASASNLTNVYSFAVNPQGNLEARTRLELGGYVQAVQATGERMLVAKVDPNLTKSSVSLIDIASADGMMVRGAEVAVSGLVQKKTNMHIQGNSLRVVSAGFGIGSNAAINHVETFDISNVAAPKAVDHKTFGAGQMLFATTFLPDRAFFVTYLRQDPFHSFSISPAGMLNEESEFVVSGWNDFFAPVHDNTSLIGIGHNDQNNKRSLSVSLYNISNLKNPNPLVMRADLELDNAWSEANWDDRAFSVLENATNVLAADGKTRETGLVLLPFSGWNNSTMRYQTGVQMFSFSPTSITRRGVMNHDSQVRRSFLARAGEQLVANLSDFDLSLFDIRNIAAPLAKSSLALTTNYTQFAAFAQVGVRYRSNNQDWWGSAGSTSSSDMLELVALSDTDSTSVLGTIAVPANSAIYNVAETLVVVSTAYTSEANGRLITTSTISTWDISSPASPRALGKLVTNEIAQSLNPWYVSDMLCVGIAACGPRYLAPQVQVVGKALVFSSQNMHSKTVPGGWSRYWGSFALHVLDLSQPASPVLQPKLTLPETEEAVALLQSGTTLWLNFKQVASNNADGQPQARYFARSYDLSTPSSPKAGKDINIPGQLVAVQGNAIYTKDFSWNSKKMESSINLLLVQDDLAYLQASQAMPGQIVNDVLVDGGKVLVSHIGSDYTPPYKVSVFTLTDKAFVLANLIELDAWANLKDARQGKAVFQVDNGFLLYDISQASNAFAQAWFPTPAYGVLTVQGSTAYLPAYRSGMYQFDLNTVNLGKP